LWSPCGSTASRQCLREIRYSLSHVSDTTGDRSGGPGQERDPDQRADATSTPADADPGASGADSFRELQGTSDDLSHRESD
jgi:hypothetical protein